MDIKFFVKCVKIAFDSIRIWVGELIPHRKHDFKYCGECVFVNRKTVFSNKENISIASNVYIGPDCRVFGFGGVDFGTGVTLGERVTIMSANHNYDSPDLDMLPFDQSYIKKPISFGEFSWIGSNVIILPGVKVGKYSIIAAGCVLTKSTEDYSIYGGNPGRLIGWRKNQNLSGIESSWPALRKDSIYVVS